MKNFIMLEIWKGSISIINYHGSIENFRNPPNLNTHSMVSSLKKVKGKHLDHWIQQV
jgi:hypothetical protein